MVAIHVLSKSVEPHIFTIGINDCPLINGGDVEQQNLQIHPGHSALINFNVSMPPLELSRKHICEGMSIYIREKMKCWKIQCKHSLCFRCHQQSGVVQTFNVNSPKGTMLLHVVVCLYVHCTICNSRCQ